MQQHLWSREARPQWGAVAVATGAGPSVSGSKGRVVVVSSSSSSSSCSTHGSASSLETPFVYAEEELWCALLKRLLKRKNSGC